MPASPWPQGAPHPGGHAVQAAGTLSPFYHRPPPASTADPEAGVKPRIVLKAEWWRRTSGRRRRVGGSGPSPHRRRRIVRLRLSL